MPWICKAKTPEIPKFNPNEPIADKAPNSKPWRAIHAAADGHTKPLINQIVRATDRTKDELTMRQLLDALYAKNPTLAEEAVPWEVFRTQLTAAIEPTMLETLNQAGEDMIPTLPSRYQDIVFTASTPRALSWATTRAAELVTEITFESRTAIREAIQRAATSGLGVDRTAAEVKQLVGLTRRQANAVSKFKARLLESGQSYDTATRRAQTYSERLLRYRAENIARTELMKAANQGHLEMLYQGADQGILPPNSFVRYWILTPDDRLCPYCAEMKGTEIQLGQSFVTPGGNIEGPPLHPQCRCTTGVRFID